MRQIRFRFDGQPINETDTPAQVGQRLVYDYESIFQSGMCTLLEIW